MKRLVWIVVFVGMFLLNLPIGAKGVDNQGTVSFEDPEGYVVIEKIVVEKFDKKYNILSKGTIKIKKDIKNKQVMINDRLIYIENSVKKPPKVGEVRNFSSSVHLEINKPIVLKVTVENALKIQYMPERSMRYNDVIDLTNCGGSWVEGKNFKGKADNYWEIISMAYPCYTELEIYNIGDNDIIFSEPMKLTLQIYSKDEKGKEKIVCAYNLPPIEGFMQSKVGYTYNVPWDYKAFNMKPGEYWIRLLKPKIRYTIVGTNKIKDYDVYYGWYTDEYSFYLCDR